MSRRATVGTALRVLTQLRRDPRTLALIFLVPAGLLVLFKYVFSGQEATFDRIGGPLVGLFPFVSMFVVASITMLRERTTGTLERLMTLPLAKGDILFGYGLAFAVVATIQGGTASVVAFGLLDLDVEGPVLLVVALAVANAVLGMALGLFASAFARSEFQAVQFLPAFVLPQILLCGLLVPRDAMAPALEAVSVVLPLTWAFEALALAVDGETGWRVARDAGIIVGAAVLALAGGAATLRRRTP
jgi:ABC-2 type transport system permease protein